MKDTYVCSGYACSDCVQLIANGESPVDISQADSEAWLTSVSERNDGYQVTLGMPVEEHNETCTETDRDYGCDCETVSFTWSSCDVCGGNQGGSRDAVSFFKVDNTALYDSEAGS